MCMPPMLKVSIVHIVHIVTRELTLTTAGPEAAKALFEKIMPDVVVSPITSREERKCLMHDQFTASMWTPEQSSKVLEQAREVNPKVKTLALPQGLQVSKGPDGVFEYIKEQLPALIDG